MRHAASTSHQRSPARLGMRVPVPGPSGRHALGEAPEPVSVDAPTVVLAAMSPTAPAQPVPPARGPKSTLSASLIAGVIAAGVLGPLVGHSGTAPSVSSASTSDVVGTTALGCDVRTSLTDTTGRPSADAVCTRSALIERVCNIDVDDLPYEGDSNGIMLWASARQGEMVKFSKNFHPSSPFTGAGVECVSHTMRSDGELAAEAHELSLSADDWVAMIHSGPLPPNLERRIATA